MDITEALAGAKLPEKTVPICLRGDLQARFEELDRKLQKAVRDPSTSLAGSGARELAEQVEAVRAEMGAASVTFVLRAAPRRRWLAILAEHPPREGNDGDRALGFNEETYFDAIIRECTVEPVLSDEQWTLLLDEQLTSFQFEQLANAAWALNRRDVDVPFSHAASTILRSTGSE